MRLRAAVKTFDFQKNYDSDWIDRIRYYYTVIILCIASAFILTKQYVGESVQCWAPIHFSGSWEQYAESYCLIENTYFVAMNASNLPPTYTRRNLELRYYQWVPFILLAIAATLYAPRLFWNSMLKYIGVNVADVSKNVHKSIKVLKELSISDDRLVPTSHYRFTILIFASKMMSLIGLMLVMYFLDHFVNIGPFYGLKVTWDLINGRQWQESGTFPRVTYCDIEIREMGSVNNWTLQCVLMVNMFNEKLFVFLWWWFTLLILLSIHDIASLLYRCTAQFQQAFIVDIMNCEVNDNDYQLEQFSRLFTFDAVNYLYLIYSNSTIFECFQILKPLWEQFTDAN